MDILDIVKKIRDLVVDLEKEDQKAVLDSVYSVLKLSPSHSLDIIKNESNNKTKTNSEEKEDVDELPHIAEYFHLKDPKTKAEEIAVLARYRELKEGISAHSSKDLKDLYKQAQQSPPKNFTDAIYQAKVSNLFIKDTGKSHNHEMTHQGKKFIDLLPNREEAAKFLKKKK